MDINSRYLQRQGEIETYNKMVKNELFAVEDLSRIGDGKLRYQMFTMAYDDKREHAIINEMKRLHYLQTNINKSHNRNKIN
jgi:hypothetical protein